MELQGHDLFYPEEPGGTQLPTVSVPPLPAPGLPHDSWQSEALES